MGSQIRYAQALFVSVLLASDKIVCVYFNVIVTGRGAVVLSFASPRKAQLFLSNAKQAKESALYLSVKDLQKFSFDDKRDKVMKKYGCS